MRSLIERLKQIAANDWRISFLAHTSDTADEAADELTRLHARLDEEKRARQEDAEVHERDTCRIMMASRGLQAKWEEAEASVAVLAEVLTLFDKATDVYEALSYMPRVRDALANLPARSKAMVDEHRLLEKVHQAARKISRTNECGHVELGEALGELAALRS